MAAAVSRGELSGASHAHVDRLNVRAISSPSSPHGYQSTRVERVMQQIGLVSRETVGAAGGVHSITASARSSTELGIEMPSALAVFRLTTNSRRVACSNGMSAGLAPLRMRST